MSSWTPKYWNGASRLPLQRLPQPQLHGGAAVEPAAGCRRRRPVRASPSARAAPWAGDVEQPGVGLAGPAWWNSSTITMSNAAGSRSQIQLASDWMDAKTCRHSLGRSAADEQLAEGAVAQDVPERRQALPQDLLAVRDEEQRVDLAGVMQPPVVERGDDRLTGAGRHHDQVALPAVDVPLGLQLVQDLALVALWPDVERRELDRQVGRATCPRRPGPRRAGRAGAASSGRRSRTPGHPSTRRRSPGTCRGGAPARPRETDVPLQPVDQRGPRQVRRPTYAVEKPVLRWNSQALACSRVMRVSYETLTSAPSSTSGRGPAVRSRPCRWS